MVRQVKTANKITDKIVRMDARIVGEWGQWKKEKRYEILRGIRGCGFMPFLRVLRVSEGNELDCNSNSVYKFLLPSLYPLKHLHLQ